MRNPRIEGKPGIFIVALIILMMTPGLCFGRGRAWTDYLWVSNYDDHTVSKIDVDTHEVAAVIPVGLNPAGIAVGFDYVYVACMLSSALYRISIDTDEVYDIIDLSAVMGGPPVWPWTVPATRLWWVVRLGKIRLQLTRPSWPR